MNPGLERKQILSEQMQALELTGLSEKDQELIASFMHSIPVIPGHRQKLLEELNRKSSRKWADKEVLQLVPKMRKYYDSKMKGVRKFDFEGLKPVAEEITMAAIGRKINSVFVIWFLESMVNEFSREEMVMVRAKGILDHDLMTHEELDKLYKFISQNEKIKESVLKFSKIVE